MNKFVPCITSAIVAFLFAITPAVAQNIQVSDLLGTVWESTKYGSSYKDKTIEQLQFIGTEHVRMVSAMYLDDRFLSDAAEVRKYSIVNSSTIRVYFTAVTEKGKYVESYYDFRLKNESGSYSFVDVTEHYSTHKGPFEFKFRHNVNVSVSPISLHLSKGESSRLNISVSPENAYVSITSDNPDVATVNSNGYVNAIDNGKATITVKLGQKVAKCFVEVEPPHILVSSLMLSSNTLNLYAGESTTLRVSGRRLGGTITEDIQVNWTSDNPDVTVSPTGEITVAAKAQTGMATIMATYDDKSASCKVNILPKKANNKNDKEAVDMGLSVKWASCNLGENGFERSSKDAGAFYAWGETETKSRFNWETYKFESTHYSKNRIAKYNSKDKIRRLEMIDDAASRKLGGRWRIPTYSEFKELLDNCDVTVKKQKGVQGLLFTSKINGNSIFLPTTNDPSHGAYWCADIDGVNSAKNFRFNTKHSTDYSLSYNRDRCEGLAIRPVTE